MARTSKFLLVLAALAVQAGVVLLCYRAFTAPGRTTITSIAPTVTQLEKLSELATLKVHVVDVLSAQDSNFWGDIKGVWLIKGDALLSVDMREAKISNVNESAKTLLVTLPQPRVIQARVDHERAELYDWQKGWLRSQDVASRIWKDAMRHAQRIVEQTANSAENRRLCRQQTELAIQQMYDFIGWKAEIAWAD